MLCHPYVLSCFRRDAFWYTRMTSVMLVLNVSYLVYFQVLLINAVKDVAGALSDLISATKYASGKPTKDPAMNTLMESAKVIA